MKTIVGIVIIIFVGFMLGLLFQSFIKEPIDTDKTSTTIPTLYRVVFDTEQFTCLQQFDNIQSLYCYFKTSK